MATISSAENLSNAHTEARRLLARGFKLCELDPLRKKPVGNGWQLNPITAIRDNAGGYGAMLAANALCSLDPDNVEPAREGLQRCGFDLDEIMAAGVRTTSTRPGSGGRSTFKAPPGLGRVVFSSATHGTILELRAGQSNLQDCLPGTVYMSKDDAGNFTKGPYYQVYATERTLDQAPDLPPALLAWWQHMDSDLVFKREQQALLGGPGAVQSVSGKGGKLAFPSRMRVTFNSLHFAPDVLEPHGYTGDGERWAPPTATGAPSIRLIPGKTDLWQSDHASDPLHGTFDAWAANVVLNHGGDVAAAEATFHETYCEITNAGFDNLTEDQAADARGKIDDARREHQKRENERIGEGAHKVPTPELLTIDAALNRFVFLSDGSRVADIFNPHYDLAYQDWAATFAASKMWTKRPNAKKPEEVPVSELWKYSPRRKTVICRTFKADGGLMLPDPNGRLALNTWRPFDRSLIVTDLEAAGIGLFLDHAALLFPDATDRGRFLDWLAHIEQRPGELPHTAWLHIARSFGLGRNWLASVLTRVWAGSVAANLDLPQLLKNGFNGQLSRKVLAVVDEIREGGRESQWEHSEKMKSTINEETRLINPKYGRQSVEFNACRWLMFSNHLSAIPMENGDRRIEVVSIDTKPQTPDYYAKLYRAKSDRHFIAAVAGFLAKRDISRFNPGAHAAQTEAKKAATRASQSPMTVWCEMLVEHWPADVITSRDLYRVLEGGDCFSTDGALNAAHRRTLEQFGVTPLGRLVRVPEKGIPTRVSMLRNREIWQDANSREIRAEIERVKNKKQLDPRTVILELAAGAD